MGNSHSPNLIPTRNDTSLERPESTSTEIENFETRWNAFINSLDISSDHVKYVEFLHAQKKLELLTNYEAKKSISYDLQHSVSYYISVLDSFDWNRLLNAKKKEDTGCTLRTLLSSTEISLRTNSVQWVYEFLNCEGLEIISTFMSSCLHLLSYPEDTAKGSPNEPSKATPNQPISCELENAVVLDPPPKFIPSQIRDLVKDCLHLSLRCLKTVLNNKHGCKRAFENQNILKVITFCLLHPSFSTKALTLELLTALCLIEGGHIRVLQAFDRLRQVLGEGLRFELLLHTFKHHETLDETQYNIDFSVACVQFFNIIVHSPEHLNLRIYLQYELFLLGLDETLKNLRDHAGDRLRQHVEAYLENRVDCSVLLEDAEAKEAAVAELERVEAEATTKTQVAETRARNETEAKFKSRELELSELIESLRSRIRDMNLASLDRENELKTQVVQLKRSLKIYHTELNKLRNVVKRCEDTSSDSTKSTACMATSTHFDLDLTSELQEDPLCLEGVTGEGSKPTTPPPKNIQPIVAGSRISSSSLRSDSSVASEKPVRKSSNSGSSDHAHLTDPSSIRRLASDAACTLTQLARNLSTFPVTPSASVCWSVQPVGWLPHNNNQFTIMNDSSLKNALMVHSLKNSADESTITAPSTILEQALKLHCDSVNDPWVDCVVHCEQVFSQCLGPSDKDSLDWLVTLNLIPTSTTIDNHQLYSTSWNLTINLLELKLDCLIAQRLLNQLTRTNRHSTPSRAEQSLFNTLESTIAQHFCSIRPDPNWPRHGNESEVHYWFWTESLLRLNLLRYQWPTELQQITDAVSTLLVGCTDVLTNSKLPIIMRLISLYVNRLTANWNDVGFEPQSLDSLIDWWLINANSPTTATTMALQPPVNGGPPAYQSSTGGSTTSERTSDAKTPRLYIDQITFVQAFTDLLASVSPKLLDWSDELEHLDASSRVSLPCIYERICLIDRLINIWRSISPVISFSPECVQSLDAIRAHLDKLRLATDMVRTVASATAFWLGLTLDNQKASTLFWLVALTRFADAFKRCVNKRELKICQSKTGFQCSTKLTNSSQSNERQKRQKHAKLHSRHHNGDVGKKGHQHPRRSTRPLDADGVMDDILAGLTSQPLRADVHTRRKETKPFSVGYEPNVVNL